MNALDDRNSLARDLDREIIPDRLQRKIDVYVEKRDDRFWRASSIMEYFAEGTLAFTRLLNKINRMRAVIACLRILYNSRNDDVKVLLGVIDKYQIHDDNVEKIRRKIR